MPRLMGLLLNNLAFQGAQGGASLLPFSDDFDREDGAPGNGWYSPGGGTIAIASGRLVITPAVGANLLTNGDMETGDPPVGWTAMSGAILSAVAEERPGGSGSQCLNIQNGIADDGYAEQTVSIVPPEWYQFSSWLRRVDSNAGSRCSNVGNLT